MPTFERRPPDETRIADGEIRKTYRPNGEAGPSADSNTRFNPLPHDTANPPPSGYSRLKPYRGLISSAAFIGSMTRPDYLVKGILLRGGTYTLTGNTGHGKTLLALLVAIRVARGELFLGRQCRKGTVAFFAGENSDNVKLQFYAMCWECGLKPEELSILWHPGVFSIEAAMYQVKADLAKFPDLSLVVFDSLQAYFLGDDDNGNVAMLKLAVVFRDVSADHPNKPVGLILAHPVKRASKDNLLPRGGSAITNELDGNLTAWSEDGRGEVHWQGKFRGPPFDAIRFEVAQIQPRGLEDEDGEQLTISVVRPLGARREAEMLAATDKNQISILAAIDADPGISDNALHSQLNISRRAVTAAIKELSANGCLRKYGSKKGLTSKGRIMLEMYGIQPS